MSLAFYGLDSVSSCGSARFLSPAAGFAVILPSPVSPTNGISPRWATPAMKPSRYCFCTEVNSAAFMGWLMRLHREEAKAVPPLTKEQELLTEIRDLLKQMQAPRPTGGEPPA